jgi:plasmid replication initiation protein
VRITGTGRRFMKNIMDLSSKYSSLCLILIAGWSAHGWLAREKKDLKEEILLHHSRSEKKLFFYYIFLFHEFYRIRIQALT